MAEHLECGATNTHLVLKREDITKLSHFLKDGINLAVLTIATDRASVGKNPCPEYIVVNTDEPYINEIIDVLKRNGHWGEVKSGQG